MRGGTDAEASDSATHAQPSQWWVRNGRAQPLKWWALNGTKPASAG